MYTSFFGLNEKPFAITPDPRYLFMSERHGEGLAHLLYGVTDSGGFIQLTGEVGTGKTTLVRTLLGQLPKEVDVALILNPQVTVIEFLHAIANELGLALPENRNSPMAIIDALNLFLLDAHANGRRIILLVDEAQNLSEAVLEQLRLLTNLETAKQKLLQIILIGQPELRDVLAQNSLRQLAQRVTGRYHLEPLSREEAERYIEHRMRVAGAVGEIFEPAARREVHRLSGGIPRLMNVICDRALLGAYSQERRLVDKATVRAAAREVSGSADPASHRTAVMRWSAAAAVVLIAAAFGYGLTSLSGDETGGKSIAETTTEDPPAVPQPLNDENDGLAAEGLPVESSGGVSESPARSAALDPAEKAGLGMRLANGGLDGSGAAAIAGLFARWDYPVTASINGACADAESAGFKCLRQRGSWSMLEKLDRPAVLTLTDVDGNRHQGVLQSINHGTTVLSFGDERISVPVAEISELWFGQYLLAWRPQVGDGSAIVPGTRGPGVLWLRQSLARIDGTTDETGEQAEADYYDQSLEARVRQFQRENRLLVDGLAGEQTQIIINSQLAPDAAPRLKQTSLSLADRVGKQ